MRSSRRPIDGTPTNGWPRSTTFQHRLPARASDGADRCGIWSLRAPPRRATAPQGAIEGSNKGGRLIPSVVRTNRAGQEPVGTRGSGRCGKTGDAECLLTFHCLSRRFAAPLAGGVAHRPCNVANDRYPRGHEFTAVLLRPSEPCPIGMPSQPQGPRSDRKTPRCACQRRPRCFISRGLGGLDARAVPSKEGLAGAI
jgi:hypothetical protein